MYDSKTVIDMHNRIIALLEERDRKRNIISRYFRLCVSQGKTIEEQHKKLRAAERKIRKLEAELKAKADFAEVKHGRWIDHLVRDWRCSECGEKIHKVRQVDGYCYDDMPNYCPNCGAKMDGDENDR